MTDTVHPCDLPVTDYKPRAVTVRVAEEDEPCEHTAHPSVESVIVLRRRQVLVFDFYRGRKA